MHIICLTPIEAGVYNDNINNTITAPPEGWAYIPDDFPLPSTFPRLGSVEAKEMPYTREIEVEREITKTRDTGRRGKDGTPIMEKYKGTETVTEMREYTMMTVVSMTEGTLPDPVDPEPQPPNDSSSVWDELDAAYQEGVDSV